MSDHCTELSCPHHGERNRAARRARLDELTRDAIAQGTYSQPWEEVRAMFLTPEDEARVAEIRAEMEGDLDRPPHRWRVTVSAPVPELPTQTQMEDLVRGLPTASAELHAKTIALGFTLQARRRIDAISRGSAQGTALLAEVLGETPAHTTTTAVLLEEGGAE